MAKRMWFTMKHHGWGWVPITWEGWASIAVMMTIVISAATKYEAGLITQQNFTLWLIGSVVGIIYVGYKKGPAPRWRWDKK